MKMTSLIALVVALFTASSAVKADDNADALKALNGEWNAVSIQVGAIKLPEAAAKKIKLTNKDGEYVVKAESEDKGTVEVDAKASPKRMVIKGTEGPNKGKTFLCIYELKGDELTVCYDLTGTDYPKEFKTSKETPTTMLAAYKKAP